MRRIRFQNRHFDQAARLISALALAGFVWGCGGNTNGDDDLDGAVGDASDGTAGDVSDGAIADASDGGVGDASLCAVRPAETSYPDFYVCRSSSSGGSSSGGAFTYEASGTLVEISPPSTEMGTCYLGARRLTIQPSSGPASSVEIYAAGAADIAATLSPLVGTQVSVSASASSSLSHWLYQLFVSDARGPILYIVSGSSCPADAFVATPPSLASLTVERGAELCLNPERTYGHGASRYIAGDESLTLAPGESGRLTWDGSAYDVHVAVCSFRGPEFAGGDAHPIGAWTLKRVD